MPIHAKPSSDWAGRLDTNDLVADDAIEDWKREGFVSEAACQKFHDSITKRAAKSLRKARISDRDKKKYREKRDRLNEQVLKGFRLKWSGQEC